MMFEFDEYAEIFQELFPSSSILDSTSVIHSGNIISDSRSIVISPLNDLIFAPKTAKQYLHSTNSSLSNNENHSLDF